MKTFLNPNLGVCLWHGCPPGNKLMQEVMRLVKGSLEQANRIYKLALQAFT